MNDVAEALDRLRARFLARAADDLADLRRWALDPPAHAEDLQRVIHRLAGAGGTFGFHRLSEFAKVAEDALVARTSQQKAALADVMGELERVTTANASD